MFVMQNELFNPKFVHLQVLHDTFFKYQMKPKLTGVGDLYFEGK
jgi:splicing factor 3B subunit 2